MACVVKMMSSMTKKMLSLCCTETLFLSLSIEKTEKQHQSEKRPKCLFLENIWLELVEVISSSFFLPDEYSQFLPYEWKPLSIIFSIYSTFFHVYICTFGWFSKCGSVLHRLFLCNWVSVVSFIVTWVHPCTGILSYFLWIMYASMPHSGMSYYLMSWEVWCLT